MGIALSWPPILILLFGRIFLLVRSYLGVPVPLASGLFRSSATIFLLEACEGCCIVRYYDFGESMGCKKLADSLIEVFDVGASLAIWTWAGF